MIVDIEDTSTAIAARMDSGLLRIFRIVVCDDNEFDNEFDNDNDDNEFDNDNDSLFMATLTFL